MDIIRNLRKNSNKKKKTKRLETMDETGWAKSRTIDINQDAFALASLNNNSFENLKKLASSKREDNLENLDEFTHKLGTDKMNNIRKNLTKYYTNTTSFISGDLTNSSTDFTSENNSKKDKEKKKKILNGKYSEDIQYSDIHDKNKKNNYTNLKTYVYGTEEDLEEDNYQQQYYQEEEEEEEEEENEEVEDEEESEEVEEESEEEEEEEEEIEEEEEVEEEEVEEEIEEEEEEEIEEEEKEYINEMDSNKNLKNIEENIEKEDLIDSSKDIKLDKNDNDNEIDNNNYIEEKLDVYTIEEIDKQVEVAEVKGKGRCMFTKKSLEPGSVIFIEKPVLIITPNLDESLWLELNKLNDEENFELPLKWHFAAFCSITLLDEFNYNACIDKWVPEPNKEPEKDVYDVLNKICKKKIYKSGKIKYFYKNKLIDPKIYDRMIQIWHYNAFGHHTDNEGLVLYNKISMLAHSCNSTACWHYGDNDTFVLRARIKLNPGDELTISYLGDDDLYKSSNIRREKLSNWLFICMCSRCSNPVDNSRGFKCPTCGIGTFFIKKDDNEESPIITKCNICLSEISENTAYEYIEYENSYIERLQETDKNDLNDALAVYVQAEKIFSQHWILFQLCTILFEGYRDISNWEKAIYYQMIRIKYAVDVIPRANYVLAWLYEELGEIAANSINTDILQTENDFTISYESKQRICSHFLKSISLLEILCGYSHDYLRDSLNKYYRIDSLTTKDAPQIEES